MGRLTQRTWARGVTTSYTYDNLSQLTGVTYSDGTPAVTYTYDRLGRQTQALTAGTCTNTFSYDAATLSLTAETQGTAVLNRGYDNFNRPTGLTGAGLHGGLWL